MHDAHMIHTLKVPAVTVSLKVEEVFFSTSVLTISGYLWLLQSDKLSRSSCSR
jgi:hypothetical protein